MTKSLRFALVLMVLVFSGAGCIEDEPYGACEFPPSYNKLCETTEDEGVNCVNTAHPQCPEGICIRFKGSDGFCTIPCKKNSDCPESGVCEEFARHCDAVGANCDKYCIPANVVNAP